MAQNPRGPPTIVPKNPVGNTGSVRFVKVRPRGFEWLFLTFISFLVIYLTIICKQLISRMEFYGSTCQHYFLPWLLMQLQQTSFLNPSVSHTDCKYDCWQKDILNLLSCWVILWWNKYEPDPEYSLRENMRSYDSFSTHKKKEINTLTHLA